MVMRGRLCLTIREAQKLTGVALADLERLRKSGELKGPAPVGKTLLIWPESLEDRFGQRAKAVPKLNPLVQRKLRRLAGGRL